MKGRPSASRRFTINCDTVEHATPTKSRAPTARSISAATRAGADASPRDAFRTSPRRAALENSAMHSSPYRDRPRAGGPARDC